MRGVGLLKSKQLGERRFVCIAINDSNEHLVVHVLCSAMLAWCWESDKATGIGCLTDKRTVG